MAIPTTVIDRVRLKKPLSPMQEVVAVLIGIGMSPPEIARELHLSVYSVKTYIQLAARKIPGDLPSCARIAAWVRGAPKEVLTGYSLKAIIMDQGREAMRRFTALAEQKVDREAAERLTGQGEPLVSATSGTEDSAA